MDIELQDINIVIPVYFGEKFIHEMNERLHKCLVQVAPNYRIIYVDDASPDASWEVLSECARSNPRITAIKFTRNFGQHYAISAGLEACTSKWVVVMDCDLQDQPEAIPKLLEAAQSGYDVALACRKVRHDDFLKKLYSKLFYRALSLLTGTRQNPEIANFGVYSKRVVDAIVGLKEQFRYFPVMVRWLGFPSVEVEVEHAERKSGKSSYNFRRSMKLASEIVIAFSDKPLKIVIGFGAGITALSFLFGVHLFIRALTGDVSVEGWSSLILSIWLIGGFLIMTLGIIGLYVGRSFEEVKQRPRYLIEKLIP